MSSSEHLADPSSPLIAGLLACGSVRSANLPGFPVAFQAENSPLTVAGTAMD